MINCAKFIKTLKYLYISRFVIFLMFVQRSYRIDYVAVYAYSIQIKVLVKR